MFPPQRNSENPVTGATTLVFVSYAVLALPVAVFLINWCAAWLAIPAVAVLLWGARILPAADTAEKSSEPSPRLSRSTMAFAFVIGSLGFCISGAGGIGPQGFDQIKHNSILADLISRSWPVFFSADQPLVYYVAYYLLPASLGKIGGWELANLTLAAETWLLYLLAAFWVVTLAVHFPKVTLLLFAFFSGLDPIGNWVEKGAWGYNPWWARLQFSDPAILIISVPQHVSSGWIGAATVLQSHRLGQPQLAVMIWALSAYWSPFVTLGLTPFVLFVWARHRGFRHHLAVQLATLFLVMLPAVLFLRAGSTTIETYKWSTMGIAPSTFALFLVLEWGVFAVLLVLVEGRRLLQRPFAILAILSLAAIPLVGFPGYTDYVARASIPALFYLALQVAGSALRGLQRRDLGAVALWAALVVGASQPLAIYRQAFRERQAAIPDRSAVSSVPQLGEVTGSANDGQQYIGRADMFFFRYLGASRPADE